MDKLGLSRPADVPGKGASTDDNYKWKVFTVVGAALFTMVMDASVTSIALPSIAEDFSLSLRVVSWVALSASLTISAALLPLGRLADIAGRKSVHLVGIALFAAGSIFAAVSPNLATLLGARVVMSVGAAMDQALIMAIVVSVFPAHERGKGLGLITMAVGVGAIAGPIIGGPLVDLFGWRSVYWFMSIPTIMSFPLAAIILDDDRIGTIRERVRSGYDWFGALTSAGALGLAILTVANPFDLAWTSPAIIGTGLAAAALGVIFVAWEARVANPMLEIRLFRIWQFSWSTVARFLGFFGTSASWFLFPFYIQDALGYSAATSGLVIFVGALGMSVMGAVSGRLSDRFGVKIFSLIGLALVTAMGVTFGTFNLGTPLWLVMVALALNGIGSGLWMAPNMSATLGAVDRANYGIVSAFLNLIRNVAVVSGIAVTTTVVATVMVSRGFEPELGAMSSTAGDGTALAFVAGMRLAFLVLAGFSAAGFLAVLMTRDVRER